MIRTTLLTAGATALVFATLLLLQAGRNRGLAEQIDTQTDAVVKLEQRAASPGMPRVLSALSPDAPSPGSVEAAIAEARANSTPQERIDRATERIEALVADLGDFDESPAELFRLLPDLLRMVQDLDIDEMVAVANKLDAPLSLGDTDGKGAMKAILMMLAAEQDPERVLQNPEVAENRKMRGMILAALARKDLDAAKRWMENSDMDQKERHEFEQLLFVQTLRQDFNKGLEMIREGENVAASLHALGILGVFGLSEDTISQIITAIEDPANEELKPQLVTLVMTSSLAKGGIESARTRVQELGMEKAEVDAYLTNNVHSLLRTDPEGTIDWLAEAQTEEQLATSLPDAIENWARHDYNAAGEWLGKMEASPIKDDSVSKYATMVSHVDPKAATIWTEEIADEEKRKTAQQNVLLQWMTEDAAAAEAWARENGVEIP